MGFLDKLFGGKKQKAKGPAKPPYKGPSRSIINDPDLKTLADFNRYYPLPDGYQYRERGPRDVIVVRQSDGAEFFFLVEEGILGFDIPRQKADGSWAKGPPRSSNRAGAGPTPALRPASPILPRVRTSSAIPTSKHSLTWPGPTPCPLDSNTSRRKRACP